MKVLETLARVLAIVFTLAAMPLTAHAHVQALQSPAARSAAGPSSDIFRSALITAAVVGGTALAIIFTNGHLFPTYTILDRIGEGLIYSGYSTVQEAVQLLGAISIAFYVDTLHRRSNLYALEEAPPKGERYAERYLF